MKAIFTPQSPGFKGQVIMKPMPFNQRWALFDKIGLKIDGGGEVEADAKTIMAFVHAIEDIKPFIRRLSLSMMMAPSSRRSMR